MKTLERCLLFTADIVVGFFSHRMWEKKLCSTIIIGLASFPIYQVYIVGHIPPGFDERDQAASLSNGHQFFSQKNNLRYLDLIRKYSSIIQGQFFGHLHSDSFRIVYNDQGECNTDVSI